MKSSRFITLAIAAALAVCIPAGFTACGPKVISREYNYSNGTRQGIIEKFSFKGEEADLKTWEGELALPTGKSWAFSVDPNKTEVVKQVNDALAAGKPVVVHYIEYKWSEGEKPNAVRRTYATPYRVEGVEPVTAK